MFTPAKYPDHPRSSPERYRHATPPATEASPYWIINPYWIIKESQVPAIIIQNPGLDRSHIFACASKSRRSNSSPSRSAEDGSEMAAVKMSVKTEKKPPATKSPIGVISTAMTISQISQ